jgi:hypothetical protein
VNSEGDKLLIRFSNWLQLATLNSSVCLRAVCSLPTACVCTVQQYPLLWRSFPVLIRNLNRLGQSVSEPSACWYCLEAEQWGVGRWSETNEGSETLSAGSVIITALLEDYTVSALRERLWPWQCIGVFITGFTWQRKRVGPLQNTNPCCCIHHSALLSIYVFRACQE